MAHLFACGHDNRGTDKHPFGYVYLSTSAKRDTDAGRVGYISSPYLSLFPCRDTPEGVSSITVSRIRAYLAKQFPEVA